jgi:hypothetical protein
MEIWLVVLFVCPGVCCRLLLGESLFWEMYSSFMPRLISRLRPTSLRKEVGIVPEAGIPAGLRYNLQISLLPQTSRGRWPHPLGPSPAPADMRYVSTFSYPVSLWIALSLLAVDHSSNKLCYPSCLDSLWRGFYTVELITCKGQIHMPSVVHAQFNHCVPFWPCCRMNFPSSTEAHEAGGGGGDAPRPICACVLGGGGKGAVEGGVCARDRAHSRA